MLPDDPQGTRLRRLETFRAARHVAVVARGQREDPIDTWLDGKGVAYDFHDYKTAGIAKEKLKGWTDKLGWETLLNRAGTTFRKLPDADKDGLTEKKALVLMLAQPSMIKRPVLEVGSKLLVGFKPEIYEKDVGKGKKG